MSTEWLQCILGRLKILKFIGALSKVPKFTPLEGCQNVLGMPRAIRLVVVFLCGKLKIRPGSSL